MPDQSKSETNTPEWSEEVAYALLCGHGESMRMLLDDFTHSCHQLASEDLDSEGSARIFIEVIGKWNLYVVAATHSIEIALKTLVYQEEGRKNHPGMSSKHDLLPLYERLENIHDVLERSWRGSVATSDEDLEKLGLGPSKIRRIDDGMTVRTVIEKVDRWNNLFRYGIIERRNDEILSPMLLPHLSDLVHNLILVIYDRLPQGKGITFSPDDNIEERIAIFRKRLSRDE